MPTDVFDNEERRLANMDRPTRLAYLRSLEDDLTRRLQWCRQHRFLAEVQAGNVEEVQRLLLPQTDVDVNFVFDGDTALSATCDHQYRWYQNGPSTMAMYLANCPNVDLNFLGSNNTPLVNALCHQDEELAMYLLSKPQIEINTCRDRLAAIHAAVVQSSGVRVLKALLARPELTINTVLAWNGQTPLHFAADRCFYDHCPDVIRLLLSHPEIDVNPRDKFGNTPLHLAVEQCEDWLDPIRVLLDHPLTDLYARNNEGQTPLDFAEHEVIKDAIRMAQSVQLSNTLDQLLEHMFAQLEESSMRTIMVGSSSNRRIGNEKAITVEPAASPFPEELSSRNMESSALVTEERWLQTTADALQVVSNWLDEVRQQHREKLALAPV